jgi:N-acetylglucosamine kinase-like BadF-type ATPase
MLDKVAAEDDEDVIVWIGAAGFSAATAGTIQERFSEPLRQFREGLNGRQCEIFIANDAVSILQSPPLFGCGVAAIVGTGSVVLGAHPKCKSGVVKRGGSEWLVSDEGAGVWMTLQCIRELLRDIQARGSENYHSVLLDHLTDFLGISDEETQHIAPSHQAMARADLIARRITENRSDTKRYLASFVHPHIFDMAKLGEGHYDMLAAGVLQQSVRIIAEDVRVVSDTLAAFTADAPNLRDKLPLVVGGKIADNPLYRDLLTATISSKCRAVNSVTTIGDGAGAFARLALHYGAGSQKEKNRLRRGFDPLHPVLQLL